jgi:hypothetical protein
VEPLQTANALLDAKPGLRGLFDRAQSRELR